MNVKRFVVVVRCRVAVEIDFDEPEAPSPFTRACEASAAVLPDGEYGCVIDQTLVSEEEIAYNAGDEPKSFDQFCNELI